MISRKRFLGLLATLLFITALYEYAWPTPTIHYYAVVMLHLAAGLLLFLLLLIMSASIWQDSHALDRTGWSLLAVGGFIGVALIFIGTVRNDFPLLYLHIAFSSAGVILLAGAWLQHRHVFDGFGVVARWTIVVVAFAAICYGAWWARSIPWQSSFKIENPKIAPASMDEEGPGSSGPFFPGSVQIANNATIPHKFFLE